jgi:hypothetical protein
MDKENKMAKENPTRTSGGFSAKGIVRNSPGITGKGGSNVNPTYNKSVPPLPPGAPKIKISPNVTVTTPGIKGIHSTLHDWVNRIR